MSNLTAFNNQLEKLIEDLINYFPENNDFKLFESSFSLLRQANPRKILELFQTHILPYKEYILAENEEFLLAYDYMDSHRNGNKDINYAENLMMRLKQNWNDIDDKNKTSIWKYFKVLVILAQQ